MKQTWIELRLLLSDQLMYWSLRVRGEHCTSEELWAYDMLALARLIRLEADALTRPEK